MRNSSVLVFALSLFVPFVTADLHYSGICVNKQGGQVCLSSLFLLHKTYRNIHVLSISHVAYPVRYYTLLTFLLSLYTMTVPQEQHAPPI
jgi:hypothetical protein